MSSNVVSIAKVSPHDSLTIVTDLPTGGVVINVMSCLDGSWERSDLYLFDETAFALLDALKDWKSTKEPGKSPSAELIAKFAIQE